MATVFNDHGRKLWPTWSGLEIGQIEAWATSKINPASPCIGIYLRQGDLLIESSGAINAPFCLRPQQLTAWQCNLSTVTLHWDSRDIVRVAKLSCLD